MGNNILAFIRILCARFEAMDVPLCRPCFDSEEMQEIARVLDSGWVSKGPEAEAFENAVGKYVSARHAIAVVNCTAALHLALLGIGVGKDDEVLVSDFTFPATGHAVLYCGARPVFVDALARTYNMNTELIGDLVTERTKAIMPVHAFGQPAEMDKVIRLAKKHGLKVIEDAACSLGATWKGKQTGAIGHAGCYSFHARKGVTTGEGGMVVTSNKELADKVRYLSVFGMRAAWEREGSEEYVVPEFHDVGFNYKLSDILAAVGVVQMRKLDGIIQRKKELAKRFDEMLESVPQLRKPLVAKGASHIYQSYVALVDKKVDRNRLIASLKKLGIQAQIGTYASHIQPVYHSKQRCPVSKCLQKRTIALPFYYSMTTAEIERLENALKKALGGMR